MECIRKPKTIKNDDGIMCTKFSGIRSVDTQIHRVISNDIPQVHPDSPAFRWDCHPYSPWAPCFPGFRKPSPSPCSAVAWGGVRATKRTSTGRRWPPRELTWTPGVAGLAVVAGPVAVVVVAGPVVADFAVGAGWGRRAPD